MGLHFSSRRFCIQENKSNWTAHPGRNDQQPDGDTHLTGNVHGGNQPIVDSLAQVESTPINSAAAAAAFNMVGSKYTGGETGRSY